MVRACYILPLSLVLLGALGLSSCGGGGGSGDSSGPPFIAAELNSFPPGAEPPGFTTNATVVLLDDNNNSIASATVTMNAVHLVYNPDAEEYEGRVLVPQSGFVALSVTVGGATYTAGATQFTSYPAVSSPASGDTWDSSVGNLVSWSGGSPTANAEYVLGILDAGNADGQLIWPPDHFVQELPIGVASFSIPAASITAGNRLLIAGISGETTIPGAADGSALVVEGFTYVPITVTGP